MNALQAALKGLSTEQIADAIIELGRTKNTTVRVALCDEYEARVGGEALDALFERELAA
jgi:hypothetical protein